MPQAPGVSRGFFLVQEKSSPRERIGVALNAAQMNAPLRATLAALLFCAMAWSAEVRAQTALANSAPAPVYKEVVDEVGRTIRIRQPVQRIVSLAPSLTETIYALGLQDRLVGDTDFCDYPADAQKKPKVGGALNPNLEELVAMRPDLVLVTKSFNRLDTVRALDGLGIPAYATDPHTVADIISSTERLAGVLGAPKAGTALVADLDRRLGDLEQRLHGLSPRRVLFIVWAEPLISVGKDTFIADALRRAGATSIVDLPQSWPQVNLEEVVRSQPDYLVLASSHSEAGPNDFDVLAARPGWRNLDAVRSRHFAVISEAVNRPAPRIVSAIEDLAHQLHPEAFSEHPDDAKENNQKITPPPAQSPPSLLSFDSSGRNSDLPGVCTCAR